MGGWAAGTTAGDVSVQVGAPAAAGGGGGGRRASPALILAVGQALLALTIGIIAFVSLLNIFNLFNLISFFVIVYLFLFCVLLLISSLVRLKFISMYFGFLNFYAGNGSLLAVVGTYILGFEGLLGKIIGGIAIAWGVFEIIAHFAISRHGSHVLFSRSG